MAFETMSALNRHVYSNLHESTVAKKKAEETGTDPSDNTGWISVGGTTAARATGTGTGTGPTARSSWGIGRTTPKSAGGRQGKQNKKVCSNFTSPAGCIYGEACKYMHTGASAGGASTGRVIYPHGNPRIHGNPIIQILWWDGDKSIINEVTAVVADAVAVPLTAAQRLMRGPPQVRVYRDDVERAKVVYCRNFYEWALQHRDDAVTDYNNKEEDLNDHMAIVASMQSSLQQGMQQKGTSLLELVEQLERLNIMIREQNAKVAQATLDKVKSEARLAWLDRILRLGTDGNRFFPGRTALTKRPSWSFAGNLKEVASKIENEVSQTVPQGRGTKEHLPLIYISNPPRHGKSLLLDTLFSSHDGKDVCVLNATYNAATSIEDNELKTPEGAVCGFLLRLLFDLRFGVSMNGRWGDIWENSPLTQLLPECERLGNPTAMLKLFEKMVGLHDLEGGAAPKCLLICIDEISKLTDDERNLWVKSDSAQNKSRFWKSIYSLTRATAGGWVRIVMTGFTDSPENDVQASDVSCKSLSLSMITNAEQEILSAELLWAYATHGVPFPGLLWALYKSTPGLLGVWAQQIRLQLPLSECVPMQAADPGQDYARALLAIPWMASLNASADQNWQLVRRFMTEDDSGNTPRDIRVIKKARNAGLATLLESRTNPGIAKTTLSPFAVAITVMALRARLDERLSNDKIYHYLNNALVACESHSAGCAVNVSYSPPDGYAKVQDLGRGFHSAWPLIVQENLKKVKEPETNEQIIKRSHLLAHDRRLKPGSAPLYDPNKFLAKAKREPSNPTGYCSVETIGAPFEIFVMNALALRLQCLLQQQHYNIGGASVKASQLLPKPHGIIDRPARHPAEMGIVASLFTDPEVDLARLCTQTAALLLPTTISCMLNGHKDDVIQAEFFRRGVLAPSFETIFFSYDSVRIVEKANSPQHFPVVTIAPFDNYTLNNNLVSAFYNVAFDSAEFMRGNPNALREDQVRNLHDDMNTVVALAVESATQSKAVLFQPSDAKNPMCDNIVILPVVSATNPPSLSVCFLFIELKDRIYNDFAKKFKKLTHDTNAQALMLGPVASALERNVDVNGLPKPIYIKHSIFVCCGKSPIIVR